MILNVDDFECTPDGRFLERASIEADSAVLTNLDGVVGGSLLLSASAGFSSVDLGKAVTIRDAGLLVTTIQSVNSST